jgi:MFS superfamily sulfate permease-like transporter
MSIEAMTLALEALENFCSESWGPGKDEGEEAITALRQAIKNHKEWVGLTDEEIDTWDITGHESLREFVRAIEAKLKEKNT